MCVLRRFRLPECCGLVRCLFCGFVHAHGRSLTKDQEPEPVVPATSNQGSIGGSRPRAKHPPASDDTLKPTFHSSCSTIKLLPIVPSRLEPTLSALLPSCPLPRASPFAMWRHGVSRSPANPQPCHELQAGDSCHVPDQRQTKPAVSTGFLRHAGLPMDVSPGTSSSVPHSRSMMQCELQQRRSENHCGRGRRGRSIVGAAWSVRPHSRGNNDGRSVQHLMHA